MTAGVPFIDGSESQLNAEARVGCPRLVGQDRVRGMGSSSCSLAEVRQLAGISLKLSKAGLVV